MIVPGLAGPITVHQYTLNLTVSEDHVNLNQRFGEPSAPIFGRVNVFPGVLIGGLPAGNPGITCFGLPTGSRIILVNQGVISGPGGAGGQGQNGPPSDATFYGGGGGGGAGNPVGAGGDATLPGIDGNAMTAPTDVLGGSGGLSDNGGFPPFRAVGYGQQGGNAISIFDIDIEIDNTFGSIWGGGGGGMGGSLGELGNPPADGGAGGAIATGSAGSADFPIPNQYQPAPSGNAGYAIQSTTGIASFFPGATGDVLGVIGT